MICEFLFFEENVDKKEKINFIDLKIQIRELLKNQFEREVLTSVLLDLRKDVSGKTQSELFNIYQDLELHKDAYQNLKSWRWEKVSKGIFELTQMEVKDSYSVITQFINDKRSTIRKQAEIATVSLKDEGVNYFLDHTRYKISEWQQLKLLDVVRNKKDYVPPPFRLWLTSKNNHVVLFSLRLINYYNQNDASASLIQLLRHKNNHIKKEAIFCIRDFHVTDAVPVLKQIFWNCTTVVKMYVLEALSHLGTEDDISFIENIVEKEIAFTVKGKAITALNTIRPEGVLPTNDIVPKEEFELVISEANDAITLDEILLDVKQEEEANDIGSIAITYEVIPNQITDTKETKVVITPDEISSLPLEKEVQSNNLDSTVSEQEPLTSLEYYDVDLAIPLSLPESDALHFEFLPIVENEKVENDIPKESQNLLVDFDEVIAATKNQSNTTKPENYLTQLPVNYEEVISIHLDENITVLSKTIETEIINPQESDIQTKSLFVDGISNEKLFGLLVIYDVVQPKILNTKKVESFTTEIEWNTAFEYNEEAVMNENVAKQNQDKEEQIDSDTSTIPKPLFYEEATLNTFILLETIAELGDHREVLYLQGLLEQETNSNVVDRINSLITEFSKVDDKQHLLDFRTQELSDSVFSNLFTGRDKEVKLMLLEEIAAVGDEKEIPLLKQILETETTIIAKTAKWALDEINLRIFHTEDNDLTESVDIEKQKERKEKRVKDELLEISFEVESALKNKPLGTDKNKNDSYGSTMFDSLCAMSTKLYDKR